MAQAWGHGAYILTLAGHFDRSFTLRSLMVLAQPEAGRAIDLSQTVLLLQTACGTKTSNFVLVVTAVRLQRLELERLPGLRGLVIARVRIELHLARLLTKHTFLSRVKWQPRMIILLCLWGMR